MKVPTAKACETRRPPPLPAAAVTAAALEKTPQTIEQARIEVERENELECIREAAATLNREREDEARRIFDLKQAAVLAEHEKDELR